VYPTALKATEPADDQDNDISSAINISPPPASFNLQWTTTAWTGNLLTAPNEKPLSRGSQSAHILLQ
jgi:hypothetical protein